MATTDLSSFGLTSADSYVPPLKPTPLANNSIPNPNYIPSKLPTVPTKINVTTGAGVPGGFSASSIKDPIEEAKNIAITISAIASKVTSIGSVLADITSGKIPPIPGLMDASKLLDRMKKKQLSKLTVAIKAPNFKNKFKFPSAPKLPSVPDFKSMGIPELPSLPSVPELPSVTNVPKLPSIRG